MKFRAYRIFKKNDKVIGRLVELKDQDLSPGEVTVKVSYSSVNYKDALGATGKGKILKRFPLIAGIDMSGKVLNSAHPSIKEGESVLVTGCGLGERHDGGYSEIVRVPSNWIVPLPENLTLKEAMIYGTAGFTAALAVHRLEVNGQNPDKGPILITGASGGVGSFAVSFFKKLSYKVIAMSGKSHEVKRLKSLGADEILFPQRFSEKKSRPLESSRFGGLVDNVGGELLSALIPYIHPSGNAACIGLAGGFELNTTVMPFILRGVSLLGISSTECPMPLRKNLWKRLSQDLKPKNLESFVSKEVNLQTLEPVFQSMIERKTSGRVLVRLN